MTRKLRRKTAPCLWIFLSLLFSSCGWSKKEQIQGQIDHAAGQAQTQIEEGRFQKAIDIYYDLRQKYPQDSLVQSGYVWTLESIKSRGDRAFKKNDLETAQNIYEILARNWSRFADLGPFSHSTRASWRKRPKPAHAFSPKDRSPLPSRQENSKGPSIFPKTSIKNTLGTLSYEPAMSKHWKRLSLTETAPLKEVISFWPGRSMNYY